MLAAYIKNVCYKCEIPSSFFFFFVRGKDTDHHDTHYKAKKKNIKQNSNTIIVIQINNSAT